MCSYESSWYNPPCKSLEYMKRSVGLVTTKDSFPSKIGQRNKSDFVYSHYHCWRRRPNSCPNFPKIPSYLGKNWSQHSNKVLPPSKIMKLWYDIKNFSKRKVSHYMSCWLDSRVWKYVLHMSFQVNYYPNIVIEA